MWLIVFLMFDGFGQFKVASDQKVYANWGLCNDARIQIHKELERIKPSPNAVVFSTCSDVDGQENA